MLTVLWLSETVSAQSRIAILPRKVASEIITSAVAQGGWLVAIVVVALDVPVTIDLLVDRGYRGEIVLPVVLLLVLLALIIFVGRRPHLVARVLFVLASAACAVAFALSMLALDATIREDANFVINRPIVALVLVTPIVMKPLLGLAWSVVGLLVGAAASFTTALIADLEWAPGWGPFASWLIYAACYLILTIIRANQSSHVLDLARLEEETRRMALENQFEQRAAAIIHDTLLGDLTAVMNSTGPLDDRARDRFRSDVATLADPSWLTDPGNLVEVEPADVALRNGIVALASEMQWRGLTVDVTGDDGTMVRMPATSVTALHAAVRACLDNVLAHSGTRSAELVIGSTEAEVTVMVIDHGVGFDPSAVAPDRLGLRASVTRRIESLGGTVRIWSTIDQGTSVMISLPNGAPDAPAAADVAHPDSATTGGPGEDKNAS